MPPTNPDRTLDLLNRIAQRVQQWNDAHNNGKPLFPPVTEAQVRAAEQRMGFRLPPFLSLLYTQIGNGGFGPGISGLLGIAGGCSYGSMSWEYCPHPEYLSHPEFFIGTGTTIEQTISHSGWRLDTKIEQMLIDDPVLMVQCLDGEPDGWITLCDIGCGGSYELDLYTGQIYDSWTYAAHIDVADEYIRDRLIKEDFVTGIRHCFSSIEEWLENWLSPKHWRGPSATSCLGAAGQHGFTGSCWTMSGEEPNIPRREELEEDEHHYLSFEEVADSEDWDWYQRQPPADDE